MPSANAAASVATTSASLCRADDDVGCDRFELALEDGRVPVEVAALLADERRIAPRSDAVEALLQGGDVVAAMIRRSFVRPRSVQCSSDRRVLDSPAGVVSIGRPARSTVRSACGRASSSVRLRARMRTRSAASPASMRPCRSRPMMSAGVAVDRARPVGAVVVEMQDPRRLAEDLEHVEIAIGVERVARVVARHHHGDARCLELVQRRDAAPARRAAGAAGPAGTCCTTAG